MKIYLVKSDDFGTEQIIKAFQYEIDAERFLLKVRREHYEKRKFYKQFEKEIDSEQMVFERNRYDPYDLSYYNLDYLIDELEVE